MSWTVWARSLASSTTELWSLRTRRWPIDWAELGLDCVVQVALMRFGTYSQDTPWKSWGLLRQGTDVSSFPLQKPSSDLGHEVTGCSLHALGTISSLISLRIFISISGSGTWDVPLLDYVPLQTMQCKSSGQKNLQALYRMSCSFSTLKAIKKLRLAFAHVALFILVSDWLLKKTI